MGAPGSLRRRGLRRRRDSIERPAPGAAPVAGDAASRGEDAGECGSAVAARRTLEASLHIEPFAVEQWMNAHETTATWNIAETCVHSLTRRRAARAERRRGRRPASPPRHPAHLRAHHRLARAPRRDRRPVRRGASPPTTSSSTNGAIGANFLALFALVEPGDRSWCASSPPTSSSTRCRRRWARTCGFCRCARRTATCRTSDELRSLVDDAHPAHRHQQPQQPDRRR